MSDKGNNSKIQAAVLSLSAVKERVALKLEIVLVVQMNIPTFLLLHSPARTWWGRESYIG